MADLSLDASDPSISPPLTRQILTVSELTQDIKKLLETGFDTVWVKGEVSSFKSPSSGHFYFTLKDEKAVLNGVMFKFRNQSLKFKLEDGLEVICGGRITLYEPRGSYQILIDVIEPVGLGALQLRFEQLKQKLEKEGLFAKERKKTIPFLPQKIAIITSPTGAAIQDMLQILHRRFSNVEILIYPVVVQGEHAAPEMATALGLANRSDHDVIIVGRGGGSLEDLWAFNEEIVARAIFESKIPVISAVGHETDFTIADFVADLRAPTPSAAAELVVKNKIDVKNAILNLIERLRQSYLTLLHRKRNLCIEYSGRLIDPRRKLSDWRLRLADLQERLQYTLYQNIKMAKTRQERMLPQLALHIKFFMERQKKMLSHTKALLETLNPLSILHRGYSITHTADKQIVRSTIQTKKGDVLSIRLFEGTLRCKVTELEPK